MAFSDEAIGTIETGEVLRLGVIDGVPFALVKEERDGLLSTVSEYYVLYGEEKTGPYDEVGGGKFTFSPDGKTIAYTAKKDDKWHVIKGKEKIGSYDDVWGARFLSDNKTLAYVAEIKNKWHVFVGKEKLAPYDAIYCLNFLDDGKTPCYAGFIGDKRWVLILTFRLIVKLLPT